MHVSFSFLISDIVVYRYLLRMAPTDALQSEALVDFIKYFRWDTMAILTDNTDYGDDRKSFLSTET